ncbi:MAG: hypothetical protein ACREE2_19850 [Stellaceae bacterium]
MAEEIRVKVGRTMTSQEETSVDKSKAGRMTAQPPQAGVSGQAWKVTAQCPYCGCIGYVFESYPHPVEEICHCCGRAFWVDP